MMMAAPSIDDEDIEAMENRPRTSVWTDPSPEGTPAIPCRRQRRPRARDKGFGILDGKVRAAGIWLAGNLDNSDRPLRPFMAQKFGLNLDGAGRAVAEAGRLAGVSL